MRRAQSLACFSASPPAGPMWGQATPYFLLSGDQFRPPPPPAFGSVMGEGVLRSDTRTPGPR